VDDHIIVTSAISAGQEKPPAPGLYDEHDHIKAEAEQRWMSTMSTSRPEDSLEREMQRDNRRC
jgi:hypothetical protein